MKELRFGACAGPGDIAAASRAGCDYVEMNLDDVMAMNAGEYRAMAAEMKDCNLYAEVVTTAPGRKATIIGEGVSAKAIHATLNCDFEAARALGARLLVFEAPQLRQLPEGFDSAVAWRQLGNFARMVQSCAADHGICAALMPLRRNAGRFLNHVSEAAMLSAILQLDRVGVAASSYNMAMEGETAATLERVGSRLWHVRMSNVLGNRPPHRGDGEDYAAFFRALWAVNYAGRVSCEARFDDFEGECAAAMSCLREAAKGPD